MITTEDGAIRSRRRSRYGNAWMGTCAGLLLSPGFAAAQICDCPQYDLPAIVEKADVALVGKVLSSTNDAADVTPTSDGSWRGGEAVQTRVLLDVSTVLKGTPPRFVEVSTPTGPCGFSFVVGKTYLLTGRGQGAKVTTDVCQSNVTGDAAIDFRAELIRDLLHPR